MSPRLLLALLVLSSGLLRAAEIKRIPPPGIAVPDADRAELQTGIDALAQEIAALHKDHAKELADVQIFHKSTNCALRYNEFSNEKQIPVAKAHLAIGMQRAKELREGKPSWNSASGLVVRGYISTIDGSVQPYGLVIPEDWKADDNKPRRLDFWLHGRGEQLSELAFIEERLHSKGEFTPDGAIVCHLYGRFCNANKFAGERDLFEALDDIKKHYKIDMQRLVVRGFSMGGASTWQFATHFPGMWAAAAPGAGFAETAEFFKVFAPGKTPPPWWEQVLWRWYDCTTMAANLANVPTVAYSGEIDGQKQAADIMVKYAKEEGIELPHIIGPKMGHKYDAESKAKIEELVTAAATKGNDPQPKKITLVTHSLKYNRVHWLTIDALDRHWEKARIDAEVVSSNGSNEIILKTQNVTAFSVDIAPADLLGRGAKLIVDGQNVGTQNTIHSLPPPGSDAPRSWWRYSAIRSASKWTARNPSPSANAACIKRHDLQGPIDDAFMSSFIFVRPTGKPMNDAVGAWTKAELEHATEFWRRVFRGEAPVKDDTAITADDIKNKHLVIWGDPSSNSVLGRMDSLSVRETGHSGDPLGLPYQWSKDTLEFDGVKYNAANHAPILIFPNPLNPQKYVVLNSGPTFREEALLNNSDQTPKLPDWAIVNLATPPDGKWPGQIVDAGFFDEQWALPKK